MWPGKPKYLKQISLLMPPEDLAKRSIKPKAPARALLASIWKYVRECLTKCLFLASSVLKHADYWTIMTTT